MGIKIKKVMGYGLTLNEENCRLLSESLQSLRDHEDDFSKEKFIEFLNAKKEAASSQEKRYLSMVTGYMERKDTPLNLLDCLFYQEESFTEALLLVPPEKLYQWQRYNDDMDYYEHFHSGYQPRNEIKLIPRPVHYLNFFYNKKLKRDLSEEEQRIYRFYQDDKDSLTNYLDDKEMSLSVQERITSHALALGFSGAEELEKMITPTPQDSVIYLAEFLGLFTDKENVYELSPMLITYWS